MDPEHNHRSTVILPGASLPSVKLLKSSDKSPIGLDIPSPERVNLTGLGTLPFPH